MFKFKLKTTLKASLFFATVLPVYLFGGSDPIPKEYKNGNLNITVYDLPNGYQAKKIYGKGDENITIYKDNKAVYFKKDSFIIVGEVEYRDDFTSVTKNILLDVDNDGVKEFLFYTSSGGAHCCFDVYLLELNKDKLHPMLEMFLKNVDRVDFKDIDGDGTLEVITYDDLYSYFGMLSFAESPFPKIVLKLKDGRYVFSKKLTKNLKLKKPRNDIELMLNYIYQGRYKEGLNKVKDKSNDFGYSISLQELAELIERMSKSKHWKEIKEMNGWEKLSNDEILDLLFDYMKKK